jgi:hypothetical protein
VGVTYSARHSCNTVVGVTESPFITTHPLLRLYWLVAIAVGAFIGILWVRLFVFGTLAFDATVILYSALNCTFVLIVLLRLCCRLNRSPVSASHPAAIPLDCSLWESPLFFPSYGAVVMLSSSIYRQSPVLAPYSCSRCVAISCLRWCRSPLLFTFANRSLALLPCYQCLVFIDACNRSPVLACHASIS